VQDISVLLKNTQDVMTTVEILPGLEHIVQVEVSSGEIIAWKFSTKDNDIGFSIYFIQDIWSTDNYEDIGSGSDEENMMEVTPEGRVPSHIEVQRGSFKAPTSGTLVFRWDNSFSMFRLVLLEIIDYSTLNILSFYRRKTLSYAVYPEVLSDEKVEMNSVQNIDNGLSEIEFVSFYDWFGIEIRDLPEHLKSMKPRHSVAVFQVPTPKEYIKNFSATVYMCEEFPLSVWCQLYNVNLTAIINADDM